MRSKFPKAVFIQTINRCNAGCIICPYKDTYKKESRHLMSTSLYVKILRDLTKRYDGQIGLYLHCEPTLDMRLSFLLEMAKKMCPRCYTVISTNGQLPIKCNPDAVYFNVNAGTKKTYERVMPGCSWEKMIENVKNCRSEKCINFVKTKETFHELEGLKKIFPDYRIISQYWVSNRGGSIITDHCEKTRFTSCDFLENNLPILSNGDVVLCCNDWKREVVIGNVFKEDVLYLWRNPRRHYNYNICKRCR